MSSPHQRRLGERLRAIRGQQGLTLQQVEERSNGQWKAVVVGAYERGDRSVSAVRLLDLARFYGVPASEILPDAGSRATHDDEGRPPVVLNLVRLAGAQPALAPVSRFATGIQGMRGDYNGRVLSIRRNDVRALAVVYDLSLEGFVARLADEGVLAR